MSAARSLSAFLILMSAAAAQVESPYSPLDDGTSAGSGYGKVVAGGGDVDGDGVNDFAVSAPSADVEAGRVYVHSGATGALLYGGPLTPTPPVTILGGHFYFGHSVDMTSDFNADGKADLLIGADQNSGITGSRGFVQLIDGATGTSLASWAGVNVNDRFGSAVASGDVDGDETPDIVIGVRQGKFGPGFVVVRSGVAPYAELFVHTSPSTANYTHYGYAVACADVNGDGFADVIVGADEEGNPPPLGPGFVEVLLGPDGVPAPYGVLTGVTPGDRFGLSVANAGNVAHDTDDFDDILVGASQDHSLDGIGYARVYDGLTGAQLDSLEGEQTNDHLGFSVAGNFDFNADGFVDFLAGAPQEPSDGQRGYVRVHSGTPGDGPPFLHRREGAKPGTAGAGSGIGIGRSVSVIGNTGAFTSVSFVAGGWTHGGKGHAEVISGRRLLLSVVPDTVSLGEIFSLVAAQLPATTPTILLAGLPPAPTALHPLQGVPLLPQWLVISSMQTNEAWLVSAAAPAIVSGATVLLQVAGKVPGENILVSDIQKISF